MRQKLTLGVGWHGLHFSVLLLKLMLLLLAPVPFGAPGRLLWLRRGKASPCGFLENGLSKKRCSVVARVLLRISALSVLRFGPLCHALPPSRASACRYSLAGGVPSCTMQLGWRGQEARALPVPAAPSHRRASKVCFHICWRGDVSADLPVACGLLPLQLCENGGTQSRPPPPVPPMGG